MLSAGMPALIATPARSQLRRPNALPARRQTLRDAIDRNYQIPHYRGCCKVVTIPLFEWRIAISRYPVASHSGGSEAQNENFGCGQAFPPSERIALPR
ncbi:protein of unknown function [Cupriavidus taiwanensis]|uniref:Uncharacterized protein n=1 Tax=Cupriavidus taiwanensis TaxID=164546 RepID=A0A9Q7UXD5_9BURK|nr:protein of unknown function [Cupriavidus taiwanensis]